MKTLFIGITITVTVAVAVALVCFVFARIVICEIHKEYRSLLRKRDDELIELKKDNARLSEALAQLQAERTERTNEPQSEFFDVPKVRR